MNKEEDNKSNIAKREEKILKFWQDNKVFEKTLEKDAPNGEFVFYDGPPFATGLPHFGHIIPGTIKDIIPRYKTMQGYRVPRKWGWDTHGLPIENLIEKELGLENKKAIEDFGIDKFNQAARDSVFRYDKEWKKIIPKTGRWADMENAYSTMDPNYTESVWWMFKEIYGKGLLNEGFKSMHLCPRCETTLSNFEVNQGYKDITDLSVTPKFELISEPGTFVLAWTTTPWTLPGNVALAINSKTEYLKVKIKNEDDGKDEFYILAKEKVAEVFEGKKYEEVEEVKSEDLIGKSYKPLFNYYSDNKDLEYVENGWKIYADDFVTTEEGTGIVHIAPAFGDEDYQLSKRENIPFVQHVNKDGSFKEEVTDFAGLKVKPKSDDSNQNGHQVNDIEIIKYLAHNGKLFSKKKIVHSYPHCWRCKTPLLNYATSSWFIDVPKFKDKLISENNKIEWTPAAIGKNRFGNWLKDAREWAISRSRFWGAPIPVWKSNDGEEIEVLGSVEDIKKHTKSSNNYFLMRHGEAEHNVNNIVNDGDEIPSKLTEKGIADTVEKAKKLNDKKVDLIFASPLNRTRETAKLVAKNCGIAEAEIILDDRLKEIQIVEFNNKPIEQYRSLFKNNEEKFHKAPKGGETLFELKKRLGDFIYETENKYKDKNILIVSHEYPIWMLESIKEGLDVKQTVQIKETKEDFLMPGDVIEYDFSRLPHNENYELDFHRPYIDDITFTKNGKKMKRVEDVFDVWIDSGSVPFASEHYPFENSVDPKGGLFKKTKGYPADFIAEGLDQTRGWFYTMLALNVALFNKAPYKKVVVNGLLLAEDGRKMSKSLQNYPDINLVLDKYGADALRYFLMASPVVKAEDFAFSEKGVDEVMKKLIGRLDNVVSFYEMHSDESVAVNNSSENILDRWMISRLGELEGEVTKGLDNYELDRATRPFMDFIDDLSTWYIRRSRDRFKNDDKDKKEALETTKFVILELAKLIAPFTPFVAEDIYLRIGGEKESVHLENWPKEGEFKVDQKVLDNMATVRKTVTLTLEARTKAQIKVRQPLQKVEVKNSIFETELDLVEILKDEVNIKEVVSNPDLESEVKLDTNITQELQEEGDARELIRAIQSMRKKAKLNPSDEINISLSENTKELVEKFKGDISETAKVKEFNFENLEKGDVVKLSFGETSVSIK